MTARSGMVSKFEIPRHVLVAGIDGSGKSTLLSSLSMAMGYTPMEPTNTERARVFRHQTAESQITSELIRERERIFLDLNNEYSSAIDSQLALAVNVATSSSALVTRLSHAVMKKLVLNSGSPMGATREWVDDTTQKPNALFLTHAPFSTIQKRITDRQQRGDVLERFWGFNSLFFLGHYQDAWLEAVDIIQHETDVLCVSIDTSSVPTDKTIHFIKETLK